VRIAGISFDISAVIFVALFFGHFGTVIPPIIERVGMVLFIFTVGIQAGPGFIDSLKKHGRKLVLLASLIVFSGVLVAFGFMVLLSIDPPLIVGLLCGALTSTPGLTVAIDATASPMASIGYGIAYPFGVIGVIVFVKLIPRLLNIDITQENTRVENQELNSFPSIQNAHFVVDNSSVDGKSLSDLMVRSMTGATISRIQHNDVCFTPSQKTVIHIGDIIKAVGTAKALDKVEMLIGKRVNKEISLSDNYSVEQVLVSNRALVNMPLSDLSLHQSFNAVVTRVRRSGIDIAPSPSLLIKFGDKLTVACQKDNLPSLSKLLGNNDKILSDTDFLPISLGIVFGILLGYLEISFHGQFSLGLGLSGGILIMAIILSGIGKTGPIVWTMSGSANQLLRQLGLLFFLAGVGTRAGGHLIETIVSSGPLLLIVGFAITVLPMAIAILANKYIFKLDLFELLGTITGGMTSTPGLAACDSLTSSNAPGKAYAAVYPIAMVVLIIFVQILIRIPI
jgi:putative transport protein